MAFFSAVSSSIGKKLLLFGLRHIDILDKDPADFVSVDVGKRTTLEVRDVGLHIKKLVALLHLKLPPEIHPSKARASLLRVTFVLEFGVPQIIIEVDGVQVHAKLVEDGDLGGNIPSKKDPLVHTPPPAQRPRPSSPPPRFRGDLSDVDSDDDEHVPTVDELANSFIREEPDEEIKELEQELNTQSEYLQDSITSSEYGDDESIAGVGAPLGLPAYLRNILNTALDRLKIAVNHIEVEVEDQFPPDAPQASKDEEDPFVSLNFHIDRIAIDSVTSQDPHVNVTGATAASVLDSSSKLGKRRMQIENIYARLKSDAVNFASLSRVSHPSSPVDTRSEVSSSHKAPSEPSEGPSTDQSVEDLPETSIKSAQEPAPEAVIAQDQTHVLYEEVDTPTATSPIQEAKLESSVLSTDDDRFADATSEDGLSIMNDSPAQSRHSLPTHDMNASSILYADDGILDYAMQNDLLNSEFSDRGAGDSYTNDGYKWEDSGEDLPYEHSHTYRNRPLYDSTSFHENIPLRDSRSTLDKRSPGPASEASTSGLLTASDLARGVDTPEHSHSASNSRSDLLTVSSLAHAQGIPKQAHPVPNSASDLLTVSALGRSHDTIEQLRSVSQSRISDNPATTTGNLNLDGIQHHIKSNEDSLPQSLPSSTASLPREEDLSESKLFTHDDAESMYMSALSAAPSSSSSHGPHVPGGWDSASSSSHDTGSDNSGPIPEDMVSGSIFAPVLETDDGCETPRPGSRQSVVSSPNRPSRISTPKLLGDDKPETRLSKLFLTIDQVTVWFPLGLEGNDSTEEPVTESFTEDSRLNFKSPNIGEDSIFQEMPGSFSNYAHSTSSRRRGSAEEAGRRRPNLKAQPTAKPPSVTKDQSATVNIEVGSVIGHIDLSTARIMFQLLNRVTKALTGEQGTAISPNKNQDEPATDKRSSIILSVKHVGFAWLERLMTESLLDSNPPQTKLQLNPLDALVKINLASIRLKSQIGSQETRAKLQLGTFVLASLDQDIITFQTSKSKSRRSISSLPEQLDNDIEIDYEQAKDCRVTVVTRPVKVNFDLQTLDDALSSFGGFSGILELGSSISSNNTIGSPVMSPARQKPRGVHFRDTPPPPAPTEKKSSSVPKIHLQFGEVSFILKGKNCAVQLQTTSIRVAVRESNVRLKVSEVQLSGPYFEPSQRGAPLMVEIRGSTVNFLFTPEEVDLTRLISMITPSKDPYENDEDILIDTLLRQRRKGSVLRAEVASVGIRISDLNQMKAFEGLGAEVARLSKVTKYLPDDDRPGILTIAMVQQLDVGVVVDDRIGDLSISLQETSLAHVGVPSLLAMEIGKVLLNRGEEVLIHEVVQLRAQDRLPMIMVRMVGDEMEPVVKAKLFNVCVEYRVSTIMSVLGIGEDGTVDDIALGLASSVATITGAPSPPKALSRQTSTASSPATATAKPLQLDLLLRSCAVGLNPRKIPSKGLFVLTEAHISGKQAKDDYSVAVELRKASMHAIDDIGRLEEEHEAPSPSAIAFASNRHLAELHELGYISLSSISAAKVFVNISGNGKEQPQIVDVEFKNELFVIESCADSTQTLIAILNGLQPPTPPSTAERYRTVVPLQQMMESFTGDAMLAPEGEDEDNFMENADLVADEVPTNLEFVGSCYNPESLPTDEELGDSMLGEDDLGALTNAPVTRQRGDRGLLESFQEQYEVAEGEQEFDFNDDYFKDSDSEHKGKARKWDSTKNEYHLTNEFKVPDAPLKVRVRDMNVIWNLYDGYDWPRTRGIIAQAVEDVEARAEERRRKPRDDDEDDDFVEEDFLFNSVWIGVPIKDEKGALAKRINHDIDDLASETGSYATSTATRSTGATARPRSARSGRRRLKLERSKHKKVAFSLMGVSVDLIVFPPESGETMNSIDVRVQDFEIFDHVPTSTWKKFVTCLVEPSQREMNRPMINLELLTVKPVTDLAASELVIRVTVLPLRLHVDQDALDFITRFFEFKDDATPENTGPSEQPFIQRLEVNTVTLKLDYKPKRVDYRGLRSGHTTEFMNFLILDGSDIILRHAIVYGITSFDKLHKTLNDVWMPDVKRNQLPGVLSGLAAVRPLVNVGSGMRDLVVVPMREYKKDGRIVRSLQKGVYAFAKNTTSEVARLGAKVAIGTQNLLEGAENFLNPQNASPSRATAHHDWDGEDPTSDTEEPRAVSHYANQPIGVRAGLRTAARYLERDLLTARDAVIAIPAEVMEEGSGVGMARAIARHAPTVILRPALGATKAVGNALLGVGNALDNESRRKIEDKYKSY